jgi:hypothetical protein
MNVDKPTKSGENGAKRTLDLTMGEVPQSNQNSEKDDLERKAAEASLANPEVTDENGETVKDRNKRTKKDGAASPSLGSAGFLEVHDRSQ